MKKLIFASLVGTLAAGLSSAQNQTYNNELLEHCLRAYKASVNSELPFVLRLKEKRPRPEFSFYTDCLNPEHPFYPVYHLYYPNGKLSETGTWMNGKWIGNYKSYYDNGNIRTELSFDNEGRRHGVQRFYFESGELYKELFYSEGKEIEILITSSKQ